MFNFSFLIAACCAILLSVKSLFFLQKFFYQRLVNSYKEKAEAKAKAKQGVRLKDKG